MPNVRLKMFIDRSLRILIGTGFFAFATKCIYDPCGMVIGGFSGIAIIVRKVSENYIDGGIPLGITTFLLNVPFFIMAYPKKGAAFIIRTIIATFMVSLWLMLIPEYTLTANDYMLTAIAGGLLAGGGIGLVFSAGSTTGGTDMVASLIQERLPSYSVAQIMAALDAVIVISSAWLFGIQAVLYAGVSLFIHAKISDTILLGTHFAKSVFIITDSPKEIASEVIAGLKRGMTGIQVRGMYTGKEKIMLFCVVPKKEVVRLKEIVSSRDESAFVIVGEATEVLGEGFVKNRGNA